MTAGYSLKKPWLSWCLGTSLALLSGLSPGVAAVLTWNGGGTTNLQDGPGNWDVTSTNRWWTGTGVNYQFWNNANNDTAVFGVGTGDAGASVTLKAPITVGGLVFNPPGSGIYTILQGTSSNPLTLAGTPVITVNVDAIISASLKGVGFTKEGSGTLTLSSSTSYPDTYTGPVTVNAGVLVLAKGTSTTVINPAIEGDLIINTGAVVRLGHNDQIVDTAVVTLNSGTLDVSNHTELVGQTVLAGGSLLGAGGTLSNSASGFDLRNGTVTANLAGPGGLTKTMTGPVFLGGTNTYLGDTTVSGGTLQLGSSRAIPAGVGKGNVYVYDTIDLNGYATAMNTLTGTGLITNRAPGAITLTVGSSNAAPGTFDGSIVNGAGIVALTKAGNDTLTLTAGNPFSGPVTVNGGTLALSGAASLPNVKTFILAGGGTLDLSALNSPTLNLAAGCGLNGSGTVNGSVVVGAGATLAPGTAAAVGNMAINGSLTLAAGGSCLLKLSKSVAATNDSLTGITNLTLGGTLTVTNLAGTLAGGDTFVLFSAASYAGAFASVVLPPLSAGLSWDASSLSAGVLRVAGTVVAQPRITSISLSGTGLVLAGAGGPAGGGYSVVTSSNAAVTLANWTLLETNQFDGGGNFTFTNALPPTQLLRFYRLRVP
jgi:autotransporter-associated beta strand protein